MELNKPLHNANGEERKWLPSKLFWKQLFICVGVWNMLFMAGMCMGTPTVLIPQLRREANSTDAVDGETASWLYSVFGTCTLPWVVITLFFTQYFGRRWPVIISVSTIFLVFLFMSLSTNAKQILVAEIMEGCFFSCCLTVCVIILSEYTIPKYRGIFLCFKSSSFFWGLWIANIIGTFFHWKNIPIFGMIVCLYSFTAFFWPESPHWLASRGRFEECKTSYRWLHGCDEESERDLATLIKRQTDYLNVRAQKRKSFYFSQYTSKEFYKPLFLIVLAVTQYHFSGKLVCSIYVLEITKKITNSEDTAYLIMLILDGVTILGIFIGCLLSRILNRRTMYISFSAIGVVFLFLISLYLYLVKLLIVVENNIFSIILLTCFSIAISCGPMIMTTSVYGEVIPLKHKTSMFLIAILLFETYNAVLLKNAPKLFKNLGFHGTFLMYGIVTGICTYLLYLYLPETKDKTLQQIEQQFEDELRATPSIDETERFIAKQHK
ncbi:PREDICTED: facilitated trehalose transporter Tret1-like [Papilio xuthus]|uniref:Facilitated trehalose transporter Tret1-like n=1 Tax=Papilio xuthus TaxID=66420 RepID=A0AAJ6ZDB1_PAPXU|nr:PREDICTED: facilitated trehalose transporter Tret1-like [Papilio xuthus]